MKSSESPASPVPTNRADDGSTVLEREVVLSCLDSAAQAYRAERRLWQRRVEELTAQAENAELRCDQTRSELETTLRSLETARAETAAARRDAATQARRAADMTAALREIHGALFSGDVFLLVLRACLSLTGATRGLYVSADLATGELRVRAAVDFDGYPSAPLSDFIERACRRVLEAHDSLVINQPADLPEGLVPQREGERFRNMVVAPVVLLRSFNGILLVADRGGPFREEDVEALLSVGSEAAVAVENFRLHQELQQSYLSTISMLADAIEAKDPYTGGHCNQVARFAWRIAQELGLSAEDQSVACYAALLHDVGKIGVSDGVLNKPGPLLPEERELVKAHVRVGHDLIATVAPLQRVAEGVLHHHEWYDGSGYPAGLQGAEIPIAARIVCAVDAYCAMVTRRSYKEAYPEERARQQLRHGAGSQFDPAVVEAFLRVLDSAEEPASLDPSLVGCLLGARSRQAR